MILLLSLFHVRDKSVGKALGAFAVTLIVSLRNLMSESELLQPFFPYFTLLASIYSIYINLDVLYDFKKTEFRILTRNRTIFTLIFILNSFLITIWVFVVDIFSLVTI